MVKYRIGLFLVGLVVLVLVIYSSGMNGPLILDDMSNIEYNPHVRLTELSYDGPKKAALDSPAGSRPGANVSFALNYRLYIYNIAAILDSGPSLFRCSSLL